MQKKLNSNDYLSTIMHYLSRYRKLALPGVGVMIAIAGGQLAGPYILKQIIDVAVPRATLRFFWLMGLRSLL